MRFPKNITVLAWIHQKWPSILSSNNLLSEAIRQKKIPQYWTRIVKRKPTCTSLYLRIRLGAMSILLSACLYDSVPVCTSQCPVCTSQRPVCTSQRPVCTSQCLSVLCMCVSVPVWTSRRACPYVLVPVCMSHCLSVRFSTCLSVHLSAGVYVSVPVSTSQCLSVRLSYCMYVSVPVCMS